MDDPTIQVLISIALLIVGVVAYGVYRMRQR